MLVITRRNEQKIALELEDGRRILIGATAIKIYRG